jgi:fructose-1,6-bisphosphatase-3
MWRQMLYVSKQGAMYLRRDHALIFHACVPVDEAGDYLPFQVDGQEYRGRALFDAVNLVVQRAFRTPVLRDLDLFWYLWGGPLSPWFGKDKMATFETYFVAEKETHKETKNPYFKMIHKKDFCQKILKEFGMDPEIGLIVNGHVPVKIEQGESPLKESGMAVTIDGAFSEAYGDKGFTLVLDPTRTYLAQHHHFESISESITSGADIIPTIQDVRVFSSPRTVADTEQGDQIRRQIRMLESLIQAYRSNAVYEQLD